MKKEKHTFYFKQFAVRHDQCSMKVGTDAVLIGAWADTTNAARILDIGTGSGVIALMLAQRTADAVFIDAVELREQDFAQATENVYKSPWSHRINIFHSAVQQFLPEQPYDLIVSNPPFFINSSIPPLSSRESSRHTGSLSYEALLVAASRLLNDNGKFCVILPTTEGIHFSELAKTYRLFPARQLSFYSRKEKKQERTLFEFVKNETRVDYDTLILYEQGDTWSPEYFELMKEFYL